MEAYFDHYDRLTLELESERFTQETLGASLLTNLEQVDKFITQQCIIEFNLYDNIFLGPAYTILNKRYYGHFGVYIINRNIDLGDFWDRFDELKGRN